MHLISLRIGWWWIDGCTSFFFWSPLIWRFGCLEINSYSDFSFRYCFCLRWLSMIISFILRWLSLYDCLSFDDFFFPFLCFFQVVKHRFWLLLEWLSSCLASCDAFRAIEPILYQNKCNGDATRRAKESKGRLKTSQSNAYPLLPVWYFRI